LLLRLLFKQLRDEGFTMSYTIEDLKRDVAKKYFKQLSPEKQREMLQSLPPKVRLAGLSPQERLADLSPEQIQQYLDQLNASRQAAPRKPRRKK